VGGLRLPDKADKGKERLVYITTASNEVVANIWKDVLEENGIKSLLKSVNLVTSMYTSPITLEYEILVLASDAEKAKEILTPFIEENND
jgi:hypothetical protein